MRWMEQLRMLTLMLLGRREQSARLDQELDFHLRQQIAENISRGMSAEQARSAALRLFGNPSLLREEARSTWSWNWMEKLWRDLRYGLRTLRRAPGFALIAILVMVLGIGATTSLFTIVRSVLLRPLPFRDPDKLVMVYERFRNNGGVDDPYNQVSPGDFSDWREQTHSFADMAAWRWWGCNLTGEHGELPEVVMAAAGSWNLFSILGISPAYGRTFTAEEDRPGHGQVVLLSWSLFERRFAGDHSIVGRQVHLDTDTFTVVGVLPREFNYPDPRVQLWVPYTNSFPASFGWPHDMHQSYVIARLRDGVSAEAAIKPVAALQYQIHMANLNRPVAEDAVFRPMIEDVVENARTPLLMLLGAVGCMLLIACLNVSNLLIARGAARRKEVAVRGALGGSRWTLVREQMTEAFLVCLIGGALGFGLSTTATNWLAVHWRDLPRADAIHLDGSVFAFSLALVVLCALLAGLVPALSTTRQDLLTVLQESGRSLGGSATRSRLRKILLTGEIALTVILLVSAGLLFKSFMHLRMTDLGSLSDNVLTIKYGLPEKQYNKPEMIVGFHEALLERVRRLPGVVAAGLISTPPGGGHENDLIFIIPEHPSSGPLLDQDALTRTADPGYFSALQVPLITGRFFTNADRLGRSNYIIINKTLADKFFRQESPLGKHIAMLWSKMTERDTFEIVGVVGDTIQVIGQPVRPMVYFPILSGLPNQTSMATIAVRSAGDPLALSVPIQKQIEALDPELPVFDVLTMQQIIGRATATQNFSATLVLAFAGLSLLLAAVGLYGVLSYMVSQRITEIGIRMALGAQRKQVLGLVFLDGLRPVLIGLILGSAGAAAAGMLIKSLLYGTRPVDPAVFAAMIASLLLTAAIASAVPALRASRIEPIQALRME